MIVSPEAVKGAVAVEDAAEVPVGIGIGVGGVPPPPGILAPPPPPPPQAAKNKHAPTKANSRTFITLPTLSSKKRPRNVQPPAAGGLHDSRFHLNSEVKVGLLRRKRPVSERICDQVVFIQPPGTLMRIADVMR